ncbi:hypothetical protein [Halalkalibaculum sp. DA384]|uniref:hypothetical protein n=1 Tax=Halalkalibaculum sp. DA384 TaxID=3373606 RepID=UPI003754E707
MKYYKMKAEELNLKNQQLQEQVEKLKQRNDKLRTLTQLQHTEICNLQNRNRKSDELQAIMSDPEPRLVKTTTIDNRNQQS